MALRWFTAAPSPLEFDADGALVRLQRGAKLAVIIDVNPRIVSQVERSGGTGVGAVLALANALQRDAVGAETDGDRTEILRDIVDEFAVGGQIENLLIEDPVVPDLRAEQYPRAIHRRSGRALRIEATEFLQRSGRCMDIFERGLRHDPALVHVPVVAELGQGAIDH